MNAIAYLRVSGLGQVVKDGEQRQSDSVLAFCKAHCLNVVESCFEAGVSGTVEGIHRPVLVDVLEKIYGDTYGACAIVVERMDRLARDLMVQELILKECRERGIPVYAADQGAPVDMASNDLDPTRKLFRQILGALAEWEKSALVLKLKKARDRKRVAEGRCEGLRPWGESSTGQQIIRYVFALRALKVPAARIARKLNSRGHTTRWGRPWNKWNVLHIGKEA